MVVGAVLLQCRAQSGLHRRIEVERMRLRILGEMGELTEEPRTPTPRDSALDLLLRTADHTQVMILPQTGDLECIHWVSSPCSRFEYNVSSSILPWTARWMIDKSGLESPANLTVLASCSDETIQLEVAGEHENWILYRFPTTQEEWTGKCDVEIAGSSEVSGPLLTAGRVEERRTRNVREVSSSECGVVPFRISFREMGLDRWIVHPVSFDARFCEGPCDEQRGHHEYLLGLLLGREESQGGRCWATCCRPSRYGAIHLIHLEKDNTFALRVMTNMIVEECACS